MSIEKVNADLAEATEHLQAANQAANASKEAAHGIWETMGKLLLPSQSHDLQFLRSLSLAIGETGEVVTPQSISDAIDSTATDYAVARALVAGAMEGSSNDHLRQAFAHLDKAVQLLREGTMDATTQSKMMGDNLEKLREGESDIPGLLIGASDAALGVRGRTSSNARHIQKAIESTIEYRQTAL